MPADAPGPTAVGLTSSATIRRIAAIDPARVAVEVGDHRLTYRELDSAADRLAHRMVTDLPAGSRIALRLADMVALTVAAIAVGRAGMVSVPIDPSAPPDQVRGLLDKVSAALLLSDVEGDVVFDLPVTDPRADVPPAPGTEPADGTSPVIPSPIDVASAPDSLASILFTSGTTGESKGVMIPASERGSMERVLTLFGDFDGDGVRVGFIGAGSVGTTDTSIHSMLSMGMTVVVYDIRTRGLAAIEAWLLETRVLGFASIPTVFRYFLSVLPDDRVFPDIRWLVSSSETLTWELVGQLRRHLPPEATIVNVFGLTEALSFAGLTIAPDATLGTGAVPAGFPLPGVRVFVADVEGRPVDDDVVGEIVVEGDSCALGYWGEAERGKGVFVDLGVAGRRVYTGDLGRLGPDGILEHLGRMDLQVKVAGNRVQPAQVELELTALPEVAAAVVVPTTDSVGDTRLAAFVVASPGCDLQPAVVRSALARRVPRFMVPDTVTRVDALPQLPNGKIDRRSLGDTASGTPRSEVASESVKPLGAVIEAGDGLALQLAALWADVLDVDRCGIDDDFFDCGGDSMRAARLFAEMERQLGLVVPLSALAEFRTPAALASAVRSTGAVGDLLVPIRVTGGCLPLFVVHAIEGDVFFAQQLSEVVAPEVPMYGLRSEGWDGEAPRLRTTRQLAAHYVDLIRTVQPEGPYHLYGWSVGGLFAFEVACQLEAAGATVALLAVGDTSAPGRAVRPRTSTVREKVDRHRAAMNGVGLTATVAHLAGLAVRMGTRRVGAMTGRQRRRWQRDWQAVQSAVDRGAPPPPGLTLSYVIRWTTGLGLQYVPDRTFGGNLLFLRAEESWGTDGWEQLVEGRIEIADVPGYHYDFGRDPGRARVGRLLGDAVRSTSS